MTDINSIDPNAGTRNWEKFVYIENNKVIKISEAPNTFKTSTGERPTDEWLLLDGYRGYIDNGPPVYDKYTKKVIKTPITDLTIGANNVVVQTYTVVNLNNEELEEANNMLIRNINLERERRINSGCHITVNGIGTISIKGNEEDSRNISNLAQLANLYLMTNNNTLIPYRDDDNILHELTPAQMSELWQKALYYVSSIYQASWIIKDMYPLPRNYTDDSYWPSKNL